MVENTNKNEDKVPEYIQRIFDAKKKWHEEQAKIPFEEKLKKLRQLQALRIAFKKAKGEPLKSWEVVWPE